MAQRSSSAAATAWTATRSYGHADPVIAIAGLKEAARLLLVNGLQQKAQEKAQTNQGQSAEGIN